MGDTEHREEVGKLKEGIKVLGDVIDTQKEEIKALKDAIDELRGANGKKTEPEISIVEEPTATAVPAQTIDSLEKTDAEQASKVIVEKDVPKEQEDKAKEDVIGTLKEKMKTLKETGKILTFMSPTDVISTLEEKIKALREKSAALKEKSKALTEKNKALKKLIDEQASKVVAEKEEIKPLEEKIDEQQAASGKKDEPETSVVQETSEIIPTEVADIPAEKEKEPEISAVEESSATVPIQTTDSLEKMVDEQASKVIAEEETKALEEVTDEQQAADEKKDEQEISVVQESSEIIPAQVTDILEEKAEPEVKAVEDVIDTQKEQQGEPEVVSIVKEEPSASIPAQMIESLEKMVAEQVSKVFAEKEAQLRGEMAKKMAKAAEGILMSGDLFIALSTGLVKKGLLKQADVTEITKQAMRSIQSFSGDDEEKEEGQ